MLRITESNINDNVQRDFENKTPRDKSENKKYDTRQGPVLRDRPNADFEAAERKKAEEEKNDLSADSNSITVEDDNEVKKGIMMMIMRAQE